MIQTLDSFFQYFSCIILLLEMAVMMLMLIMARVLSSMVVGSPLKAMEISKMMPLKPS